MGLGDGGGILKGDFIEWETPCTEAGDFKGFEKCCICAGDCGGRDATGDAIGTE